MPDVAWLSASSAVRLLDCPAAVTTLPRGAALPAGPTDAAINAGSLAHRAVERWVRAGGWRREAAAAQDSLAGSLQTVAAEAGVALSQLRDGRTTEARLRVHEGDLATALQRLAGPAGSVKTEVTLHDTENRIWGTLDLLAHDGRDWSILDVKTGADAAGHDVQTEIQQQLLVYADLVMTTHGKLPRVAAVFSLRRGLVTLPVDGAQVAAFRLRLLDARSAWLTGLREARPDRRGCTFCRRRFDCPEHWEASSSWSDADGVQGVLVRCDHSQSGRSAVLLRDGEREAWVHDLANDTTQLTVGALTRAVRVRRQREDGAQAGTTERWRAGSTSDIRSLMATPSHPKSPSLVPERRPDAGARRGGVR